ncbi:aspartic peptidase domain-containing protein [Gigaspora rosea]|uniref:Aspartic peptidase domain-containing protein n=1 Tax=Gigaspora rosea TaxID=44941 RepID=A0A397VWJ5_9GLOM|nr:aspartic peptidase domain-containing protein [Gigaspora rosea]
MSNWLGYYGPVIIGGQTFNVFFDLSSSDFWVPSIRCDSFACKGRRRFNESLSETFEYIGTPFIVDYDETTEVHGFLGKDQLSVGGIEHIDQKFGLTNEETGFFNYVEFDGMLGMGFGSISAENVTTPFSNMVNQKDINPYFGFHFRQLNDTNYVGTLTLGEIDSTKLSGSFSYNKVSKINDTYMYWMTMVDGVSINDNKLKYEQKIAVFDTVYPVIFMPPDDADAYHKLINGSKLIPSFLKGVYVVPCNTTDHVEFIFGKNSYSINPIFSHYTHDDCMSSVQYIDSGYNNTWVFGEAFLRDYYSVYNIDNFTIGLAPVSK